MNPSHQDKVYLAIFRNVMHQQEDPKGRKYQIFYALLTHVRDCINRSIFQPDDMLHYLSEFRKIMDISGIQNDLKHLKCSPSLFGVPEGVAGSVLWFEWIDKLRGYPWPSPWRLIAQILRIVDWLDVNNFNLKTHNDGCLIDDVFAFFNIGGWVEFRVNGYYISDRSSSNVNTGITVLLDCLVIICQIVAPYPHEDTSTLAPSATAPSTPTSSSTPTLLDPHPHPNTHSPRAEMIEDHYQSVLDSISQEGDREDKLELIAKFARATLNRGDLNCIMDEPTKELLENVASIQKLSRNFREILSHFQSKVNDLGNRVEAEKWRTYVQAYQQAQKDLTEYNNAVEDVQTTEKVHAADQKASQSAEEAGRAERDWNKARLVGFREEKAVAKMYQALGFQPQPVVFQQPVVYQHQPVQSQMYQKTPSGLQKATGSALADPTDQV